MSLKPYSDPEPDHESGVHRSYRRSSQSSWVAVAAMAFAFILLGGFIKTYRQLQELQEETRREISELRQTVRRLQAASAPIASSQRNRPPVFIPESRDPERNAGDGRAPRRPSGDVPAGAGGFRAESPGNATPATVADLPAFDDPEPRGIRYQWGRRSGAQASRSLLSPSGGACQVISISAGGRRVMIEGGRDLNHEEGVRLELCRDGRWIGDLRVVDVFDNQSSCEVLHATLPPEPGDTVRMPEKSMQ